MGIEPRGAVVSIDIEGKFAEPGNVGADEPAAEGEDQPVIGERSTCGTCGVGDLPAIEVDTDDLARHALDADRFEHLVERHPDAAQIGLVIPHADRVPLVAIDHGHLDRFPADTELVQGARRAGRAPQPGEPGTQDEDARRHRLVRLDRLDDLEALELGVSEIERPVLSGAAVGEAECFRPRPGFEIFPAPPHRVGGVENVVLALRSAQQMKLDKARHIAQMRVARCPDALELRPRIRDDFETVHRNEHLLVPQCLANVTTTPFAASSG